MGRKPHKRCRGFVFNCGGNAANGSVGDVAISGGSVYLSKFHERCECGHVNLGLARNPGERNDCGKPFGGTMGSLLAGCIGSNDELFEYIRILRGTKGKFAYDANILLLAHHIDLTLLDRVDPLVLLRLHHRVIFEKKLGLLRASNRSWFHRKGRGNTFAAPYE